MNRPLSNEIREIIEFGLTKNKEFIIFPFGDVGIKTLELLKMVYDCQPAYIIDDIAYKYNSSIKTSSFLGEIDCSKYCVIMTCINKDIYGVLKRKIKQYFNSDDILELDRMKGYTICGKYSYGPLCQHVFVESVGAFCSFAEGVDVVPNHAMDYISLHPFIYRDKSNWSFYENYHEWGKMVTDGRYFPGVKPKGIAPKSRRISIGNDVWLGKNVIIVNGSNIGNGVIAGAGAIITKDVPDYAIVVGNPARIIKYRYSKDQIDKLNSIKWWDWNDDLIRKRYDDFFLPVDEFIAKYI